MPITALYAGLLAPVFMFLAFRVIAVRKDARVAIGDGGNSELLRRMRVHANFAEYAPLSLLLIGLAESLGTSRFLLHALGAALLAARVVHAFGVSRTPEKLILRQAGMIGTFTVMGFAAAACIVGALSRGVL